MNNPSTLQGSTLEVVTEHVKDTSIPTAASNFRKYQEAWGDIVSGVLHWQLWSYMAFAEIRRRYHRTLLGPFWSTMSVGLYIGCMGFLFAYLWKTDIKHFFPYFCSGYICWTLFSSTIIDGCSSFFANEGFLKQKALPYSMFNWLVIYRNLIIFAHHFIIYAVIVVAFRVPVNANTLLFIPGMFLLCFVNFWITILLGLLCSRYRDFLQVISTFLQIAMFLTPVFWSAKQLQGIRETMLVVWNPLNHYINLIRAPLLGEAPTALDWYFSISSTIVIAVIAFYIFGQFQRKLIYWL